MNQVAFIGRLTKDPVLTYTKGNNKAVTTFTLAVNRAGAKEHEADFFSIVAWGNTAEFCSKHFTKGLQIGVTGRLQNRSWDDNEGKRHYITEVIAERTYFADGKREQQGDAFEGSSDGYYSVDDEPFPPFR